MRKSLLEQLNELKGQQFYYNTIPHTIISYVADTVNDRYTVKTDRRVFESNEAGIRKMIRELLPVEEEDITATNAIVHFREEADSTTGELRSALLDAIEQVKNDPGYIKQAQAINALTKTMIYSFQVQHQLQKGR